MNVIFANARVEYFRFDNMALTDSTHETSSRLVKLSYELRSFSHMARKVGFESGCGDAKVIAARKQRGGFSRRGNSEV